ncbi:MAG: aminotransferase class IV [Bacteroidales bacterium]|nr:aminotransferase class IV [Bacteroidales bacterium]
MECIGKYYYSDGLIIPAVSGEEAAAGETSFYEVIRTSEGVPLFFDDHMQRLQEGIGTRYNVPEDLVEQIASGIRALFENQPFPQVNIRVTVSFTGQEHTLHICYLNSFYPTDKMYDEGVNVILYHAERINPGVKLLNIRMRLAVNEEMKGQQAYEALLVNRDGFITEGSRSNVFFVTSDGCLYTAPDKMVLQGITRKYIIDICRKEGIRVYYEMVEASLISMFTAVFLTGTSPMVLPVERIENVRFITSMALVANLRSEFETLAAESIRQYIGRA